MAWLTGWNRRKSKIVNGSTTSQVNYQMQLTVHKGTGTDTATDIYLGTNVRDDFGDVRFTSSNGSSLLNYWIESYTSGSVATVWIQIDSIPTTGTTIYIYYDYPSQTTTSSGTNTFPDLFDDFLGTTIDSTKWTLSGGTASVSGGILTHTFGNQTMLYSNTQFSPAVSLEMLHKTTSQVWQTIGFGNIANDKILRLYGDTNYIQAKNTSLLETPTNFTKDIFTRKKITWDVTNSRASFYENDVERLNSPITNGVYIPPGPLPVMFFGTNATHYFDWILVRKYSSPEPTFGASGVEEGIAIITATYMTVTTNQTPCLHGVCIVTATVTWTNQGTSTGSFVPSLNIDGTPITSPYPSENLNAGASVDHAFDITNLATGTRTICPNPN